MNFRNLQKKAAPAALLAFGMAVSGCATNSIDRYGMQTTGTHVLLIGHTKTELNEGAARANVLEIGTTNPNPIVARAARELGCVAEGSVGDRIRRRDDWRAISGQDTNCPPQQPAETNIPRVQAPTPGQP
jgi:hypothetical protein